MSLNYDEIVEMVNSGTISYNKIGEKYNVSGSYIRKFLKSRGFILPSRRKINPKETFNKGKTFKEAKVKEKEVKKCIVCGKDLTGHQQHFCSTDCKRKYRSQTGYNTKYARLQDKLGIKRKIEYIKEHGGCCSVCGYKKNLASLGFHHVDPNNKSFNITSRDFTRRSKVKLEEELKKCIIVCHNCHGEIHFPEYNDLL